MITGPESSASTAPADVRDFLPRVRPLPSPPHARAATGRRGSSRGRRGGGGGEKAAITGSSSIRSMWGCLKGKGRATRGRQAALAPAVSGALLRREPDRHLHPRAH